MSRMTAAFKKATPLFFVVMGIAFLMLLGAKLFVPAQAGLSWWLVVAPIFGPPVAVVGAFLAVLALLLAAIAALWVIQWPIVWSKMALSGTYRRKVRRVKALRKRWRAQRKELASIPTEDEVFREIAEGADEGFVAQEEEE